MVMDFSNFQSPSSMGWSYNCMESKFSHPLNTFFSQYILADIKLKELCLKFHLLNIYGPHVDHHIFWEDLINSSVIYGHPLIIGKDLNSTISQRKVWDSNAKKDPLFDYFSHLVNYLSFIDLGLVNISPTWWNSRIDNETIAKRLCYFLILSTLISLSYQIKSCVEDSGLSDHFHVLYEMVIDEIKYYIHFMYSFSKKATLR